MTSNPKVHAFDEVATHNQRNDCWVLISGKVYDVTTFLYDHPGGDDFLLSATEKDSTDDFEAAGHSNFAIELMKKYYVGEVDRSTIPVKPPPPKALSESNKTSGIAIEIILTFIPLLILGLSYALCNTR